MPLLYELDNIVQRFGEREVLNIPALRLEKQVIYALLGPNGAGKTTLMRILSFIDAPFSGNIAFMGEAVPPERASRYRARVVWVPQSPVMFTGTLLYNIEYPMRLKGVASAGRRSKALELLESVELTHLAKAPAHRLSGGEAQRASIARALAAGAEVILFDEPTASVDFRSRGEIINLIRELWRSRGLSVIVTTHDAELAEELCQERITLFDGRPVPALPGYDALSGQRDRQGIPYGLAAWPGRLLESGDAFRLLLPARALGNCGADGREAALIALSEQAAGFFLRLNLPGCPAENSIDVFLPFADNAVPARKLRLGSRLVLASNKN